MTQELEPIVLPGCSWVMAVEDEYRKQAERCLAQAEGSMEPADRAFWLLLAQNWQLIAQDSQQYQFELKETAAE